jgi:hypothetical protein
VPVRDLRWIRCHPTWPPVHWGTAQYPPGGDGAPLCLNDAKPPSFARHRPAVSFPLGQTVITPNAAASVEHDDVLAALRRHASGDWGELGAEDRAANDRALVEGTRLLSAYRSRSGIRFWIITEADRSVTTILLPEDY